MSGGAPRHSALVRATHWLATICVFALLLSGLEIVVSHPRFYWGNTGNPNTPSLFDLPIPASRPWVNTGYNFVLPDQNGWSRNLHFEAAWLIIFTGLAYVVAGFISRHFRQNLLPAPQQPHSYNNPQRLTYLFVIFVLLPLAIWTGLAMSPGIVSVFPALASVLGGFQSARTIHFSVSMLLILFVIVHILMVWRAGFRTRVKAMIKGSA